MSSKIQALISRNFPDSYFRFVSVSRLSAYKKERLRRRHVPQQQIILTLFCSSSAGGTTDSRKPVRPEARRRRCRCQRRRSPPSLGSMLTDKSRSTSISFSPPRRIQNYVAIHKLAHSKHDLDSDVFWNTIGNLLPDYRDRREWLRVNGNQLTV